MKKTLLSILSIAAFSVSSFAQCTPNAAYASESFGLYPGNAAFVTNSSATAGVDYLEVLHFTSLVDTTIPNPLGGTISVTFDAFRVADVVGLPTGFSFSQGASFNPTTGWENGGTLPNLTVAQHCMTISALAADVTAAATNAPSYTDYPLTISMDGKVAQSTSPINVDGQWMSEVTLVSLPMFPMRDYTLRVYPSGTVGIVNQDDETGVSVYPNPSNGVFQLSFSNIEANATAVLYDLQGREVWSKVLTNTSGVESIDLAGFTAGMYTLLVRTDSKMISKKLIIE